MDLWIIYSAKFDSENENPATRMLAEAKKHGIEAELKFSHGFKLKDNKLYYMHKECKLPKIAFLRGQEPDLMEFLEKNGVRAINSSFTIRSAGDKLLAHKIVAKLGIPQIKTIEAFKYSFYEAKALLGLPFILKYRYGSRGKGIYLIHDKAQYASILKNISLDEFIIQEYIAESYGRDVRTYLVGDMVVASCLRENHESFLSNLEQGGLAYPYDLSQNIIKSSLDIKKALKGDIISVDYVISDRGLLFCEANTNAGFSSFSYLGYDMRKIFMSYIKGLLN